MKIIVGILLGLLVVSCNGDQTDNKVISMEDLVGETGAQDDPNGNLSGEDSSRFTPAMGGFIRNQLTQFDTLGNQTTHPMDRFGFSQREKLSFVSKTEITTKSGPQHPSASLYYYTFSDTLKTKNAFYNWLDCFGKECQLLKLNEEIKTLETNPLFSLIYDTTIVVVDYRCEDAKFNWKPFEDSIVSRFGSEYNYKLKVGCGGPVSWK
jgi:hypothetical protein